MSTLLRKKYHYFYKITHNDSKLYYYGIHSTDDFNDDYWGSGIMIRRLYRVYGRQNFKKEILKTFNTRREASEYEKKIVTKELLKDPNCLNLTTGGDWNPDNVKCTKGLVTVRGKDGKCFDVSVTDPRFLSGELVTPSKGYAVVRGEDGRCFKISVNDPDYKAGKYKSVNAGNKYFVGKTIIYRNGEYKTINKVDFEQYKQDGWIIQSKCKGRISPTKGMVHLFRDDKNIMVPRNELETYLNDGWENKRNVQPSKGKIWVIKDSEERFIRETDLNKYISQGWKRGAKSRNKGKVTCSIDNGKTFIQVEQGDPRLLSGEAKTVRTLYGSSAKGRKYMSKDGIAKRVKSENVEQYLQEGWVFGNYPRRKS